MAQTLNWTQTMRQCLTAPISTARRREIPSLSETMRQQLKRTRVGKRPDGHQQSLANQKVRDGRVRACGYLEDALLDEFDAGMTTEQFLAFVGAFRRWGLMHLGVIGDVRDVRAAYAADVKAQAALEPKRLCAFDIGTATVEELDALQPTADWEAEASGWFALSLDVERVRRWHQERDMRDRVLVG